MRVAIIGRTEVLFNTVQLLRKAGHDVVCIITAKAAPEYTKTEQDFQFLAKELGVPFSQGSKIDAFRDILIMVKPDIAVSINYTGVIPQSVINIFPLGVLNAHGGDLPRYRGNACQAWAILNGEKRIGLCIHKMIGGELDSGDILAREYVTIDLNTKITHVLDWMAERTPLMMLEAAANLAQDPNFILESQSKDPKDALRCYPRRPEDGRIDWSKPAIDVLRLINASNKPYSGAFCFFEGEKMVVWDAELVEQEESYCAVPGQVSATGDGFVEVVCGEGKLRMLGVEICGDLIVPSLVIRSIRKRLI